MKIQDKAIDPYFIEASEYSFDIKKKDIVKDETSKNFGKEVERNFGYYSDFGSALQKISKLKALEGSEVKTISEYIQDYKNVVTSLKINESV